MAVTGDLYGNAIGKAFAGGINWASDTIKIALLGSGYTPNLSTHVAYSDVSGSEVTGTGYTAGGATLASKTSTYTAANSWATAAATSTVYATGAVVRPGTGNGFLYRAIVGGTSGASAPSWPTTVGQTVTDGSVTWTNIGFGILQLDAADASWATSTITASYAAVYDSTNTWLIALISFGAPVSSTAGTFTVTFDTLGIAVFNPS